MNKKNQSEINTEKITSYWIQSSDNDFDMMNHLFDSKN